MERVPQAQTQLLRPTYFNKSFRAKGGSEQAPRCVYCKVKWPQHGLWFRNALNISFGNSQKKYKKPINIFKSSTSLIQKGNHECVPFCKEFPLYLFLNEISCWTSKLAAAFPSFSESFGNWICLTQGTNCGEHVRYVPLCHRSSNPEQDYFQR